MSRLNYWEHTKFPFEIRPVHRFKFDSIVYAVCMHSSSYYSSVSVHALHWITGLSIISHFCQCNTVLHLQCINQSRVAWQIIRFSFRWKKMYGMSGIYAKWEWDQDSGRQKCPPLKFVKKWYSICHLQLSCPIWMWVSFFNHVNAYHHIWPSHSHFLTSYYIFFQKN